MISFARFYYRVLTALTFNAMAEFGLIGCRKVCQPFLISNPSGIENPTYYFVPFFQILPAPIGVFFKIFEKIFDFF